MACVHNQAKINDLNKQIEEKKLQICNLQDNIKKSLEIEYKYRKINDSLGCVVANLEGQTVVSGKSYDNGKMDECLKNSFRAIDKSANLREKSEDKILLLEMEIEDLNSRKASLQGDCSSCSIKNNVVYYGKDNSNKIF